VVIESPALLRARHAVGTLLETTGTARGRRPAATRTRVLRFLIQNQDNGAPIGTDNRLFLTLGDGALTGTFQSQIKDTGDNVIFTATGDYAATPVGSDQRIGSADGCRGRTGRGP